MRSSPSRPPAAPMTPAPGGQPEVLPFAYIEVALQTGSGKSRLSGVRLAGRGGSDPSALAASASEREGQARELGRKQGESESRTKFEEQLARERSALTKALADFARDRAGYYLKVEEEAVRLA